MYLDEKLLQMQMENKKREELKKHLQEIKEDISRQEREQKSVEEWVRELACNLVDINGKRYVCEKRRVVDKHIGVYIFPEDVEKIFEDHNVATIIHRTLEIGTNVTFLNQPAVIKNQKEFQEKLIRQYKQDKLEYCPLDSGVLVSGKYKVCFAEGITTSAVGGVFINNFFCGGKKRTIIGNYSCKLSERYSLGNLFRAMLTQMFEEDK